MAATSECDAGAHSPSRQQRQVGAAPWTGDPRSDRLLTGEPAWLPQPRASQRGACTGPTAWQERRLARSAPAAVRRSVLAAVMPMSFVSVDRESSLPVMFVCATLVDEKELF